MYAYSHSHVLRALFLSLCLSSWLVITHTNLTSLSLSFWRTAMKSKVNCLGHASVTWWYYIKVAQFCCFQYKWNKLRIQFSSISLKNNDLPTANCIYLKIHKINKIEAGNINWMKNSVCTSIGGKMLSIFKKSFNELKIEFSFIR